MNWSEAKIKFQNALDLTGADAKRLKASMRRHGLYDKKANSFIDELLKKIEKGERFLASLEELKGFSRNVDEKVFIDLLEATTFAIKYPNSKPRKDLLLAAYQNIDVMLTANSSSDKDTAITNVEIYVDYERVAICVAGVITASVAIAILLGGPFGLIAVAIAGTLCALVINAFAEHNIDKNKQFLEDEQLNVISEFVKGLTTTVTEDKLQTAMRI